MLAGLVTDAAEKHRQSATIVVCDCDLTLFSFWLLQLLWDIAALRDTIRFKKCSVTFRLITLACQLQRSMKWAVKRNFFPNPAARIFSDSQPRGIEINCGRADQRSLSIELLRTTASLIPRFAAVIVASMATMVLFVTRSLWQFQVVRGGLLFSQGLYGPTAVVETLPRPVMRTASCSFRIAACATS